MAEAFLRFQIKSNHKLVKQMFNLIPKRTIAIAISAMFFLIVFIAFNPFSWNDAGNRTVVERTTGEEMVQFAP